MARAAEPRFVSTGRLPARRQVAALVREAHERFRDVRDGEPGRDRDHEPRARRDGAARLGFLLDGLSRFAGRTLVLDEDVLASALATNHRNRRLAALLAERGLLGCEPGDALDLYTRQSSVSVTARDLAVMGATLADGGVNPRTGERVVGREACRAALAVMATAGMYGRSGEWLVDVGLPAKGGIGGGIVTVSPGKGGLGVFSPPLDPAGNSVRGGLVARFLSRRLGLDLFVSEERGRPAGSYTP